MARKTKDLKPDVILKNYWRDNEQFADLFNAVLFQGRQVIKPEELEDLDTEESSVLRHREYTESIQASRDIIKIRKRSLVHQVEFVMLGQEAQERVHYAMPMRVMGYDYGVYKKQYDDNARNYKTADGMDNDEYLSKMKKTDKFIPVITVVVYYGEKPWDGATSLHEMLAIPEDMKPFINDYKMLLIEARKNNLALHNHNNIDLFSLLGIILNKDLPWNEARKKAIEYAEEHDTEKAVVMTVAGATNCKLDYNALDKKGDVDMSTVFEETRTEGRAEEIIAMGYEFGLSEKDILQRLQTKLNISFQKAQEYLNTFGENR